VVRKLLASEPGVRAALAVVIVVLSVLGVSVVSMTALLTAEDAEGRAEAGRLVFASVLPLVGTWVGTVLAFYYARDNLQAATESTLALRAGATARTPVDQVMIPFSRIDSTRVPAGVEAASLPLAELDARMSAASRQRWPVFTAGDTVAYVVHRSTLDAFVRSVGVVGTATLGDLAVHAELGPLITALGFVGVRADVDDARVAMRSVPNCNDVFVTSDGSRTGVVTGWLTNTMLAGME